MFKRVYLAVGILISGLLAINALLTAYGAATSAATQAAALAGRADYLRSLALTQGFLGAGLVLICAGLICLRMRVRPVTDVPR
ncbi:hypothetical protein [Asticcacaulis solisilvae]|uniref:hypothetical protein n=1 Tax=Asticcacaulis solisilvae TaxID=1217274 RepID=UPI003FD76C9F